MSTTRNISYEQFAENFAELMTSVRDQQTPIVVAYASGEKLLITPYAPSQSADEPRAGAAPVTDERTQQSSQDRRPASDNPSAGNISTDNISSVGAMYDIDPNSVTPG